MRVGLDVGGTKTEAVALSPRGEIIGRVRRPTGWGSDAVIQSILAAVAELAETVGFAASDIETVGIGIPGVVEPDTGQVLHAVNLGVESLDIPGRLVGELAARVRVANDVKAATIGAASLRGEAGSMAYLNLGTGVAAGIILGGDLWHGAHGTAGEVGHISVDPNGRLCGCGQRGCIEALCGGGPVARAWGRPGAFPIRDIFDAADAGDAQARELRDGLARAAAAAVRVLVLTADVEVVVLGGGLTALGERLEREIVESLRREGEGSAFLTSLRLCERIEMLPAGSPAAALGAALIGADRRTSATGGHDTEERAALRG
ncbi:ROK family protein [Microbacterium sp. NIBRBAC000506063]|uniref:ROK family protein n=1 Tax=Microbacterium sp. NIBRBAC000506063 TaxID=2734618 RepID=UPI001BB59698|nr:ROK family protein [Microbacterium sp. NIBRBAC000506063]QTV79340.1 ROK family protein [Microbacterium sp. NIBRBAC000506063]